MISLSRMISLAARGGIGIEAILDQLKSCGSCPSYAVRNATKKDCSLGSCCPVAVGNALKEMHKEMQNIICECKNEYIPHSSLVSIALENYIKKEYSNSDSFEECPNCHEKSLIMQGGCNSCVSCGFSKCS